VKAPRRILDNDGALGDTPPTRKEGVRESNSDCFGRSQVRWRCQELLHRPGFKPAD